MEEREGGGGGTARRAVRIDGWGLYVWQPADDGRPCTRRRQLATPVPRAPCRATCCQPAFICMQMQVQTPAVCTRAMAWMDGHLATHAPTPPASAIPY